MTDAPDERDARDVELEEVEEQTGRARRQAEEHGTIPDPDQQTLLDPDGDGDVEEFEVQPPG